MSELKSVTAQLCEELAVVERYLDGCCPCACGCGCRAHPVYVARAWNSRGRDTFRVGRCGHCLSGVCGAPIEWPHP